MSRTAAVRRPATCEEGFLRSSFRAWLVGLFAAASSTLSDRHQWGRNRAASANVASGASRALDGKPHRRAEIGQVTDLAGAVHTFPEMRFPAPSSSSPSSTVPAASHRS